MVEAQSNDLRASTDTITADVNVVLRPPSISADGFQHYINQGGSEMVLLIPSGSWTEAGVRVGKDTYRSFPVADSSTQRLALFAYPWDTPIDTAPVVYAKNSAGTEVTARFWFKIFPKKFRMRDLTIDDKFLNKVVNQIDPGGSGDLLTRFLKINGEMRRENNKTLSDLRFKTADKFLWTQSFLQLANSKVESEFADVRSYIYKGKKVDRHAGVAADEIEDPRPYCEILRQWSTFHPEFSYLPRKFKIAVTGAKRDRAAVAFHDIGIRIVENDEGERGFEVQAGGGQGRTPRHRGGDEALPPGAASVALHRGDHARLQPARPARQHLQGAHQNPGRRDRRR